MRKIKRLSDVRVDILPPRAVMLISKYCYGARSRHGKILKISSNSVLKDLEKLNDQLNDKKLEDLYDSILEEFNSVSNVKLRTISIALPNSKPKKKPLN